MVVSGLPLGMQYTRMASTGPTGSIHKLDSGNTGCDDDAASSWCGASHRRLSVVRPDLVSEWVPELNDDDVCSILSSSAIRAWWRCNECGVNYQATVRDRAEAEKGCPECAANSALKLNHNSCIISDTTTEANGGGEKQIEAGKGPNGGSLVVTHPTIALRWDYEKNGLLHPTDVDATSELNVWWRPAPGRPPHEASFRRPVFAFIETPYSIEEQLEAQASLELNMLQQVRQASKIDAARDNDTLPAAARMLDDIVFRGPNVINHEEVSSMANGVWSHEGDHKKQHNLDGKDLQKAIELWKRNYKAKLDAGYRPMFYSTDNCDGAAATRDQVLTAYDRFVSSRKAREGPVDGEKKSGLNIIPSAIDDPDWLQYFTLRTEDVVGGHIAPSARLVLPEKGGVATSVDATGQSSSMDRNFGKRRVDTLPPPPEEYGSEVRTMFAAPKRTYPRRPPQPPKREDDVTEALPKVPQAAVSCKDTSESLSSNPPETSFAAVSLAGAQSLVDEYSGNGTNEVDTLFDASGEELRRRTLLGPTAISSMTAEQARALQYNRGAPRPRRTGRFRLRPPTDIDSNSGGATAKGNILVSTIGSEISSSVDPTTQLEGEGLRVIQAPGTPRKVSRPRKGRAEEASPRDNQSSGVSGADCKSVLV